MPENAKTITTFATAGGPMAVHGGTSGDLFKTAVFMVLQSIGESSRRVYLHTYYQWWTFAERQGLDPLDLSYEHILAFLQRRDIAHATRQSWKTHMLRLLDWLEESEAKGDWYGKQRRRVLKFVKVKRMEEERGGSRSQRALNWSQVVRLLDVWADDPRPVGIRNYALLRLMIYTGLRRAEVATLRWDDISFGDQTVTVRHGKGDKRRIAAIADKSDDTINALSALREAQAGACDCIFPAMTVGRNPKFVSDRPMSAQTIVRLLKLSSQRAGIGHLSAHDLRRTHITLALDRGAPLQDMQAQAGHANPSTTLLYAQPADAKDRRTRIAF
ncbi:MAG: site-specific integrase [Chloroflexi bacterium]|nr:site-specific integrase [Chloroflexota bacterium]